MKSRKKARGHNSSSGNSDTEKLKNKLPKNKRPKITPNTVPKTGPKIVSRVEPKTGPRVITKIRPNTRPNIKPGARPNTRPTVRKDSKHHKSKKKAAITGSIGGRSRVQRAVVDKNRKGFAFLIFGRKEIPDLFVPPTQAEKLFQGDLVEVTLDSSGRLSRIHVLERRFRELVGLFTAHPLGKKKGGWVVYEKKRMREEIYVPELRTSIQSGDWVRIKLHFHEKGPFAVTGEVLEVYGKDLPASADLQMIAAEYNLVEEHSKAAEDEAKRFPSQLEKKDFENRTDLRKLPFITIDGITARDFDDAVFVERTQSGHCLWVAIADVSHYVQEGTPLDKDARERGTSVYFPERAFHMLPRKLSETLCSLKPNELRLTQVAKIEFDLGGQRISTQLMEAVIESKRRATYEEIQAEWQDNKNNRTWEYSTHFELYQSLRKMRMDRGSIDFELPEAEVVVDPNGEVIEIRNRPRLDSHRLIEEFMIAANEAVTDWMMEREWPFVYRVHQEPSEEALRKFQALAETVGIKVSLEESSSPKTMAEIVRRLDGHPAQTLLNMALLRSLKQAVYSSSHGIHYGLASPGYTHFTSPIRRYPDLVVHRLIRMALQADRKGLPLKTFQKEKLEKELAEICEHCSYRERLAADADREAIKLKQVRAIAKRLGDEFNGRIVGMISAGMFVQTENPYVEGLVSVESMSDDHYEFNEERLVFFGLRKKRIFKIGDRLVVRAVRADLDRRQIDFSILEGPKQEK